MRPCFLNGPSRSSIEKERQEKFSRKEIKIFVDTRILNRLEIKPLILVTNKHCHRLLLLLVVFRFLV